MRSDGPVTNGVLYIATGAKYIRAAMRSALTVRTHSPDLPTHLYGDWDRQGFDFGASPYPFTSVATVDNPHRRSKVDYMSHTPFERTLFLDTDTALNADVRGMFQLLDRFDIALAHAHRRNRGTQGGSWRLTLPSAFPQYNSGVMLFRRTPAVLGLLDDWRHHFHEAGFSQDQWTLRELLWLSDLRIATLPPEYNLRFLKYHYLWYGGEARTHIFHSRRYYGGFWLLKRFARKLGRPLARAVTNPARWLPGGER